MAYQIDRSICLCCHNCALECPMQAIDYEGTSYSIDPEKCIDCGKCARVCNVGAPKQIGAVEEVVAHERTELSADAVVLGAGASGIVAAARLAKESGKKVIVLEKAAKWGGSGWFAGFSVPEPGAEPRIMPHFAAGLAEMRERGADPELMDMALHAPSDFFAWFRSVDERVDQLWKPQPGPGGISMDLEERVYFNTKNTDKAIGPGRSTSVMEKILTDHFEEWGITLLTGHEAVAIEKDENGAVCGVLAKDAGGEVHVTCKTVISCTGGYANNEEMLRKYAPQYYGPEGTEHTHRFAAPTNTGDVMKLGYSVGAYLDEENFTANVFGPVHHPFSFILFCVANQPFGICVNVHGKRFKNESMFGAGSEIFYHQDKRIAWTIIDENTRVEIGEQMKHGPDAAVMGNYDAEWAVEEATGVACKIADTLEELAEKMGVDKDGLLETVARYNEACANGTPDEMGKEPRTMKPILKAPFYGIFGKMACDGAFGGMLVNAKTQVYNADKSGVIPGLFACGDNSSGWCMKSRLEGDHRLMATNECNWAVGSGFTAGTEAAAYLANI